MDGIRDGDKIWDIGQDLGCRRDLGCGTTFGTLD